MSHQTLQLVFRETGLEGLVEKACSRWEGTPYRHGRCQVAAGVDCLHFAAAVLDALYGTEHSKNLSSLPADACVHNRSGVEAATRALLRCYPMRRVRDDSLEAGDLVITGPYQTRTASHLMVAGQAGRLWHATVPKVGFTGYSVGLSESLICVYRAVDKELWNPCLPSAPMS